MINASRELQSKHYVFGVLSIAGLLHFSEQMLKESQIDFAKRIPMLHISWLGLMRYQSC